MAARSGRPTSYDSRHDVLEVAREEAPYREENRASKQLDPEAVRVGAIDSLNVVVDWIEEGKLKDAAELANFVIDDLEDIGGGGP